MRIPASRAEIRRIQTERKRVAVEQARRSAFWKKRLPPLDLARLDDPEVWRKIPILDKDTLRALPDSEFYGSFCIQQHDGVQEYWRSGGVTGQPLFYPRSFRDMEYGLEAFARTYDCAGAKAGDSAHVSFPMGIHPVGQVFARCAASRGITVNWAGAGTSTPSAVQLELIQRLKPTLWLGMSSYALHLANLAEARGLELKINKIMTSAEPVSQAKRDKIERTWSAKLTDTFGMTEAGMMGAEDKPGLGFRIWTDMYYIEVLDPKTLEPAKEGEVGTLVVTSLWSNNVTPFLRWSSGDLVTYSEADDGAGPFSVFPRVKHAHRTAGFFKIRGVNLGHQDLEDFMFRHLEIGDFRAEAVNDGGNDILRVSIEIRRGTDKDALVKRLVEKTRETFELLPQVVVLETGTLAREFEANVKAARFLDRRG
ncbi:MAG: Coenzyme synthetase [Burkholderiales bacterium]|jgi:phenylacetate-CoA ligase|nr:Coenzyme synthetase [Burkholderiales bacterium]